MIATAFVLACNEINEFSYRSYADAERQGHTGPGHAVPECVPRDATSIRAASDVDSNEQWIHFLLGERDVATYERGLTPLEGSTQPGRPRVPNWTWWPRELTGTLQLDDLRANGYRLRTMPVYDARTALVAIRGTDVYCWCP